MTSRTEPPLGVLQIEGFKPIWGKSRDLSEIEKRKGSKARKAPQAKKQVWGAPQALENIKKEVKYNGNRSKIVYLFNGFPF